MKLALRYPVIIEPLSPEDGGGFGARAPDLDGCMSDGETPQEAVENVLDAIEAWIAAARRLGHDVPAPSKHVATA
ncbi:MAG: type II toxin-antitoxin system HicB family antitoxin [Bauldia sp.]|nr:type II toxin-antitoxin system HicB family antitoxin [Bauldia sp.]